MSSTSSSAPETFPPALAARQPRCCTTSPAATCRSCRCLRSATCVEPSPRRPKERVGELVRDVVTDPAARAAWVVLDHQPLARRPDSGVIEVVTCDDRRRSASGRSMGIRWALPAFAHCVEGHLGAEGDFLGVPFCRAKTDLLVQKLMSGPSVWVDSRTPIHRMGNSGWTFCLLGDFSVTRDPTSTIAAWPLPT